MFGNKRGMMAQLIGAFVMIVLLVAFAPMVINQIKTVQSYSPSYNDSSSMFDMGNTGTTMMTVAVYGCIGLLGVFVILMTVSALRSAGLGGGRGVESDDENDDDSDDDVAEEGEESDDDDDEDLDEDLDEEDEDEEEEDEDIEDEDEPRKERRHSAIVTTIKKDGKVKTNVKITNPSGYNVDKYEIDKPVDTKLSLKEENFKKTKYD